MNKRIGLQNQFANHCVMIHAPFYPVYFLSILFFHSFYFVIFHSFCLFQRTLGYVMYPLHLSDCPHNSLKSSHWISIILWMSSPRANEKLNKFCDWAMDFFECDLFHILINTSKYMKKLNLHIYLLCIVSVVSDAGVGRGMHSLSTL